MTKIDIISGFLGAGKTTFIKKLLEEAIAGEEVVLIENEFGEIGIDGGFLKDSGIEIREMNSGCICCSLVGDFGKSLSEVLIKYKPDRVIIEPSGVGKLSDVMKAVRDVASEIQVTLNSAVTIVDASKCKMYMKNFGEFFNNQIENAGTIVLSRTDIADPDKVAAAVQMIRGHNAQAAIVTTPCSELNGKQLLEIIEKRDTMAEDLMKEVEERRHHIGEEGHHHHESENCHHHGEEGHHHHEGENCHYHGEEGHHHEGEACHHHHEEEGHHHEGEACHHHHEEEGHHHHEGEACHHHHGEEGHRHEDENCHHHHEEERHHHNGGSACDCAHEHVHGDDCGCGCHDHDHHHHADEVFTSWGLETVAPCTKEQLQAVLDELAYGDQYGEVLRAKGMLPSEVPGEWLYFDMVPEQFEIRSGKPDYTGKVCVIGAKLNEEALNKAFGRS